MARLIPCSKAEITKVLCIDVDKDELPKLIGVANEFNIADFQIRLLQSVHPFGAFNVRFTIGEDGYDLFLTAAKKHLRIASVIT